MARKTKKMNTSIQLPILNIQKNSDPIFQPSAIENPELDAILASVFRIFAARGRAIREAREKFHPDCLQDKNARDLKNSVGDNES